MSQPTDDDCIFCRIVAGDISGRIVYESEEITAFLDANPLSPGHTLVIPSGHFERLADVPGDTAAKLFSVIHELVPVIEGVVDADGATVGFNDGTAAGQEVPHVHGHIIPRFDGDGGGPIHAVAGDRPNLSDDELDAIGEEIDANL